MTLEKIAEEQAICRILLKKSHLRSDVQNEECLRLIIEYQRKYDHPFPISVLDKYMEQIK